MEGSIELAINVVSVLAVWPPFARGGEAEPAITVLERTAEPLLKADRPWEDYCLSYI